ncbi:chemotaxis protein CheA [Halobellus ordinarius]|uniref:chemotaxis protein CheA n=1 Tax=Halobellus ordinarius TaxID=3075120 RepID=UPI002880299F|nr:chemotaxis protein CheA [Halobellus sp. ZY16]
MDDELYQEFITESEESITQLNNSLLDLEANPDDEEAIDDIFRQAHTLKGNFGAMGFDNASTVAHAVEDLLDAVRQGEIEVTHERMDLVFDGMDEILDILHEIEEEGESTRDPSDLVDEIRAAAEPESGGDGSDGAAEDEARSVDESDAGESTAQERPPESSAELELAAEVLDPEDPALADTEWLFHAEVALDAGEMKGVDGGLFVDGLPEELAVVGAKPSLDRIEEGDFGETFVVFVADETEDKLDAILRDLWKVESVSLTDVSALLDGGVPEPAGDTASTDDSSPADGGGSAGAADDPVETDSTATDDSAGAAPAGNSVPDSDVDPDSAAAAVDAVVDAYSSDGTDDAGAESGSDATASSETETSASPAGSDAEATDAGDSSEASPSSDSTAGSEAAGDAGGQSASASGSHGGSSDTPGADTSADDGGGDAGSTEESDADDSDDSGGSKSAEDGDDGSDGGESTPSISEVKSVRVDVDQLDELHSLVEQLVTSRIKLRQAVEGEDTSTGGRDTLDELDKISSNLQDTVMDMRLIPLKKVFDKFPRLVRDLAREEEKRVNFSVEGENIELDRTILDEISDPLMHVLRNAVDHGIEAPEEREAVGKPAMGSVELRAEREHDTVVITVEDDGGGIDADALRDTVAEEGIRTREELAELPDEEIYDFIFHPGLSTNDEITDVSGRGVGMDVVKTTVESLDGSVDVDSTLGEGTTVSIRLPVSVAIIKVLFVEVGDREFGVPIKYIDEISRETRIQRVDGAEVIVHEERIFPLIRLREALDLDTEPIDDGMVVRIRPADRQVALQCEGVSRQEEVVVTPLQGPLRGTEGLSGTAVVGDGNVVPILDVNSLRIPDEGKQARRQWVPPEDESAEAEGVAD